MNSVPVNHDVSLELDVFCVAGADYCLCCTDVHNAEFILTGVLTQKLNYDSYPLQPNIF